MRRRQGARRHQGERGPTVGALKDERDRLQTALHALDGIAPGRSVGVREVRPQRPDRKTPRGPARKAILELAEQSPGVTAGDVAKATGMPRATAATVLTQLRKAGALDKRERGYAVASKWSWHDDKAEVPA